MYLINEGELSPDGGGYPYPSYFVQEEGWW